MESLDPKFPSGPWIGFYVYSDSRQRRHRMDIALTFARGRVSGSGSDDIGRFTIQGKFDGRSGEVYWTKTYIGAHDVFYRGFREGRGIWGLWEIFDSLHGGFHIWPLGSGMDLARSQPKKARKTMLIPATKPLRVIPVRKVQNPLPLKRVNAYRLPNSKLHEDRADLSHPDIARLPCGWFSFFYGPLALQLFVLGL